MAIRLFSALFPLGAAVLCGCVSELEPAADAQTAGDDRETAVASAGPVEIRARGKWKGEAGVLDDVTPVELTLVNGGDRPVRISYSSFKLEDPLGRRYAAVPPWKIHGEAVAYEHDPTAEFYRPTRLEQDIDSPSIHTAPVPFAADTLYSDPETSYGRVETPLPTVSMVQNAMKEGVIAPGEMKKGYVYFKPIGTNVNRVLLDVSVHDATTGQQVGLARIPFVVD
jgi:hypothetical protein